MSRPVVLVVEDSAQDVTLLRAAFDEAGVEADLELADGVRAAMRRLLDGCRPALVLLDLQLAGEDGLSLLSKIRQGEERLRALPVVVISTSSSAEDASKALALGADEFLTKPTSFSELCDLARRIRDGWLRTS